MENRLIQSGVAGSRRQAASERHDVPVKAVQKALKLLDHIAIGDPRREGVSLATLAETFGWPVNSTHNLLKTLAACDYVDQRGRGIYVAGSKCAEMQRVAAFANPVVRNRMLRELQQFATDVNEGCSCVILANAQRQVVGKVDSAQAVRVSQATVESSPFFAKATGRMLAALAAPRELERIVELHGLPGPSWDGLDDWPALRHALDRLREDGYCVLEEIRDGLVSLACPVRDGHEQAWGVLGVYAPLFRCPDERRRLLLDRLRQSANHLAASIHVEFA